MTSITCVYPECNNMIWITVKQKRELIVNNYKKYGHLSAGICCSAECKDKLIREWGESEFLTNGTIKNRERALVIHGADTTKRIKEKEVHIITGNVTEQRARCLYEKLISTFPRKKRKFLTSNEVQEFLLTDLPDNLKAPLNKIEVTAWVVMNKTEEVFPSLVSITRYKGKSREISLINSII